MTGSRRPARRRARTLGPPLAAAAVLALSACASGPSNYPTRQQQPLVMVPASRAAIADERGAFRAYFCQLTAAEGASLPEPRACADALVQLAGEADSGFRIDPQTLPRERYRIAVVLGIGWDCLQGFVDADKLPHHHLATLGYDVTLLHVDALSGSARNASEVIRQLGATGATGDDRPIILVGYSKGAVDILEAVARNEADTRQVVAVLSVAGSIGGSPLADKGSQGALDLIRFAPGGQCDVGDDSAVESLRTDVRQAWLAQHSLPTAVRSYSMVALPQQDRVSTLLLPGYATLAEIHPLNDSNVLFYDALIPGSTLLGYANADHWAVSLPVARSSPLLGATVVSQNNYPREVLWQAMIDFIVADLESARQDPAG
ncbi:MAG: hypothetical protein KA159_06040 [Halioglobus sp.]|nr:hypothetical protein [Halioglobus sp.]MBP6725023.1 hypothetical protein [Halioglobus sp.]